MKSIQLEKRDPPQHYIRMPIRQLISCFLKWMGKCSLYSGLLLPLINLVNGVIKCVTRFRPNEGVIVLGATNRVGDLDKALLRSGRFDVEVQVPAPDLNGRREILEHYLSKVKRGYDVDTNILARRTIGLTGADLENMVNQAALRAAIEGAAFVLRNHLEFAHDKIVMGKGLIAAKC